VKAGAVSQLKLSNYSPFPGRNLIDGRDDRKDLAYESANNLEKLAGDAWRRDGPTSLPPADIDGQMDVCRLPIFASGSLPQPKKRLSQFS
jgi:hypothetical protein